MNQFPQIIDNPDGSKAVDARQVHAFIGSKQDFSNWITNQIAAYGFIEGEDFSINLLKISIGRPRKEYILPIDTAKELAMVERNEKGRAIRKYFIEVEKKAREVYKAVEHTEKSRGKSVIFSPEAIDGLILLENLNDREIMWQAIKLQAYVQLKSF